MGQSNISIKRFVDILSSYPSIDRIVVDNVNKLLIFSESEKSYRSYLIDLIKSLKKTKCSLIICETGDEGRLDSSGFESFECDGVEFLPIAHIHRAL